jgi:hypothetical protein
MVQDGELAGRGIAIRTEAYTWDGKQSRGLGAKVDTTLVVRLLMQLK